MQAYTPVVHPKMRMDGPRPRQLPTETRNTVQATVLLVLSMTGTTWRVNTARSVMPMFLVILVYALYRSVRVLVFTPRNDTVVCCLLPVLFGVLDLVYAVWRLVSWRSECIDARTSTVMTGTCGVVQYTLYS